jgi:hypothetical protein
LQIGSVLKAMVDNKETQKKGWVMCKGHVGHPLAACITKFDYRVDIIYK